MNRRKTFLDKVTASDIAYTILIYEKTKEVWEEEVQIKTRYKNDEERCNATHHKKPKYHVGRGNISKGLAMAGQTVDKSITKNCS